MAAQRKKTAPRYAVNISLKAWDIAKAGAAITFKVRDRDGLLGTIEIGQGRSAGRMHAVKRDLSGSPGGSWPTYSMTFRSAGNDSNWH